MSTAKQATDLFNQSQSRTNSWANIFAITAAMLIGVFILSTVGLAGSEVLHNAAHDIRHGLAFPCH